MQNSVAPPLGQGRYHLVEVLGAGGMAVVYKAYDARLDVARAVKVLNPTMDDHARIRFFNEARTMAKLHHRNLVTVHDVADDGDRTYLVMELIEGGSIADRMASFGALPPKMACQVCIATLEGLHAAHSKGIVHRDVKPHNVLVDHDGTPKVTDFGIASVSDYSATRTGAMIGTWAYMSPEQRSDAKGVDARADVFAAACTLYNMITGVEPFDLYNKEAYEEKYADIPEPLRPIIQKGTRYKAEDRYEDARAFADALRAVVDELPDDPPDTPELTTPLIERAQVVPTLPDYERSSPSLRIVQDSGVYNLGEIQGEQPAERSWLPWAGAGATLILVLAFLGGGLALGLITVGVVAVLGTGEDEDPALVEPTPIEAPVPAVDPEPTPEPEPEPVVEPEPTPEPTPEPVEAPAPAPVVASPKSQPRPKPRPDPEPEPEPEPVGRDVVLGFRTIPAGGSVSIDGQWHKAPGKVHLPLGSVVEVIFEMSGKGRTTRMVELTGARDLCMDFSGGSPIPCI